MDKFKKSKKIKRRGFIRNSVIVATGASILPLSGCNEKGEVVPKFIPEGENGFLEGVASFDPTQESIVLWTRYTKATNEVDQPVIFVDLASDNDFKNLVVSETVEIDMNSDYTINVDISNLNSNTKYFYRFRNEKTKVSSIVGQTKTLPAPGEANEINIAVVSCANYETGYFNMYESIADSEADLVVHLGDYIYESSVSNDVTTSLGREHNPPYELLSLDDYRTRYRQYRKDTQLQKVHQLKPFICVWDDHEFADDAYKDGAGNHQDYEGPFETRKAIAMQVWHEYLPARVVDKSIIYRNFEIGGFLNLIMLDTRIVGREKQLNYKDYITADILDKDAFEADWQNPNSTILGDEQRQWLKNQFASSNAKWQVLGNQVLMGRYLIPAELIPISTQISSISNVSTELIKEYNILINDLLSIKSRIASEDPTVTADEKLRVETVYPSKLDYWDGYPVERETILSAALGKKLISVAGSSHNAWHIKLTDKSGNNIGTEFATASITSNGIESIVGDNPIITNLVEQTNVALIDDLQYMDAARRGYLMVTFSETQVEADWRFAKTIVSKNTETTSGNTAIVN